MRPLPLAGRCHEDFASMTGDARARHCDRCGIVVHDLSERTEEEARALVASDAIVCVRFAAERNGNVRFRAALAGAVAVSLAASTLAMASSAAPAQPSPPNAADAGKDTGADVEHWMGRK